MTDKEVAYILEKMLETATEQEIFEFIEKYM